MKNRILSLVAAMFASASLTLANPAGVYEITDSLTFTNDGLPVVPEGTTVIITT